MKVQKNIRRIIYKVVFLSMSILSSLPDIAYAAETTLTDQTDIAVTVYNNNLALVRDQREISLDRGELSLKFMDVADKIRPETVSLRSISKPGSLSILEQNYEYDLMSPAKMMEKYVGKKVELVNFSNEIGFTRQKAELLSVNEGPMYKVGEDIYLGHPGTVVLPEIPENLISKPTLVWLLNNDESKQKIEATYLTGGISWKADYVVTLEREEKQIDLAGWVTLNNNSGAQYTDAQLKLVAGEVNIAQPEYSDMLSMGRRAGAAKMAAPMREESFAEYHLYTLPRRTTIKQKQSKQVSLLTASGIDVKKIYEYRGNVSYYYSKLRPMKKQKVGVFLKFENKKKNQLGIPLPAGVMRVYQEDSDGMLQFSGEDRIGHTPKDEEVRLKLGNAFDIVGERTQTDFEKVSNRVYESTFEIKVRNHKETAVKVDIVEPMQGDWTILEKSQKFVKKDAYTAIFTMSIPKDGEAVVTYKVRIRN